MRCSKQAVTQHTVVRPCSRRVAKEVLTPACYEHPQRPLRALNGLQLLRQRRGFFKWTRRL